MLEVVEDFADVVIDALHAGEVVAHVFLVFPFDEFFAGKGIAVDDELGGLYAEPFAKFRTFEIGWWDEFEIAASEVFGDGLLVLREGCGAGGVVIEEGVGLRDDAVFEESSIALVRLPSPVGGFLVEHEEEWFVLGAGLEEFDSEVAGDVGAVALDGKFLGFCEEGGVPVGALSRENDPAVEADGVAAEVPFSDHAGVVTALLHVLGDGVT